MFRGNRQKKFTLVWVLFCLCCALWSPIFAQAQVDIETLAEETLILSESGKTKTVIWWLVPEFWDAFLMETTDISKVDREQIVDLVHPYHIMMVINQTGSLFGLPLYTLDNTIRKTTFLSDDRGNTYQPLDPSTLPSNLRELLDATSEEFVDMMGVVGAYAIHMLCFPRTDTMGREYANIRKNGTLTIHVEDSSFAFQLPIQAVLHQDDNLPPVTAEKLVEAPADVAAQEMTCPSCGSSYPLGSNFCPLDGTRLIGTQTAPVPGTSFAGRGSAKPDPTQTSPEPSPQRVPSTFTLDQNGLVAYYELTEVQNPIADRSGNKNHGAALNTTWEQGVLRFHGNSLVEIPHSASLNISSAITIEVWAKLDSYSPFQAILNKSEGTVTSWGLQMSGDHPYNKVRYVANYRRDQHVESVSPIPLDKWTHIAVTNNGKTVNIYINGRLDNSLAANLPVNMNTDALILGCDYPGPNEYFTGSLQRVIIYNRVLAADEIMGHYAQIAQGSRIEPQVIIPPTSPLPPRSGNIGIIGGPVAQPVESAEMLTDRAGELLAEGLFTEALELLGRATKLDPTYAPAYRDTGIANLGLGFVDQALSHFHRSEELNSRDDETCYYLHLIYSQRGDGTVSLKYINRALDIDPTHPVYYHSRATLYQMMGQYNQAITDYERAQSLAPGNEELFRDLGDLYHQMGEHQRAIDQFTTGLQVNPYAADLYYNRGNAYYQLRDYKLAKADYDWAIRLDPQRPEPYFNKGLVCENLGQWAEVAEAYWKFIQYADPQEYAPFLEYARDRLEALE